MCLDVNVLCVTQKCGMVYKVDMFDREMVLSSFEMRVIGFSVYWKGCRMFENAVKVVI